MHIFFSGIGGSGLSSLAHIALDLGFSVSGSDLEQSTNIEILRERGANIYLEQNSENITILNSSKNIEWFVYTAALKADHAELQTILNLQKENPNLRISKRDEFINYILTKRNLKLIAVAGTHGKTTTTAMLVWLLKNLSIPVSYFIGSAVSFGFSGHYEPKSEYFIMECDEFDRNFLHFNPHISLIPSLDYDHPDTYPTEKNYQDAFSKFIEQTSLEVFVSSKIAKSLNLNTQSLKIKTIPSDSVNLNKIKLHGLYNRQNAELALFTAARILDYSFNVDLTEADFKFKLFEKISTFPGTDRRFEKIAPNIYSDYAHHPVEISAVLELATELKAVNQNLVIIYQPHQNIRQYSIKNYYKDCFNKADKIYWLPTYLSRENPDLAVLSPQYLTEQIQPLSKVTISDLNTLLIADLKQNYANGNILLFLGAGNINSWLLENVQKITQ